MSSPVGPEEPVRDRFEIVLVLAIYVIPLGATVAFLAAVGLPGLALALLAVEAGVSAAVVVAKRPEGGPRRPGPWGVGPMVWVLVAVAVTAGLGAFTLLSAGRG